LACAWEKDWKRTVVVPGLDQLVPMIDTFIAAVQAGELDKLLAHQAKRVAEGLRVESMFPAEN
jgi:hypothetical protein